MLSMTAPMRVTGRDTERPRPAAPMTPSASAAATPPAIMFCSRVRAASIAALVPAITSAMVS